ncbi:MAG: SCP2 sterol-binding domain-containing protein [Chloroflexi bacterium]|nr:SCP2 sterol-binding domain-containing protein [Chloroflexota bacterium]
MAKYFSQEWCDLYKEALNNSKTYEESAKTWEDDFYFICEKGGPIKENLYMYVDLFHGKCRAAEIMTDLSKYKPEFIITTTYAIWKRIITKQLDSTQALITKQSKLTGNMAKIMRYTKAANEITNITRLLPTDWPE